MTEEARQDMQEVYNWLDTNLAAMMKPYPVACSRGCSMCCYEPNYTHEMEVRYMLDGIDPALRERIIERTRAWLEATKDLPPFDGTQGDLIDAIAYRRRNLPCPFLENNECSVYARRPFGCRTFFAIGDAQKCRMPERIDQVFAQWSEKDGNKMIAPLMYVILEHGNPSNPDHLGRVLAKLLELGSTTP